MDGLTFPAQEFWGFASLPVKRSKIKIKLYFASEESFPLCVFNKAFNLYSNSLDFGVGDLPLKLFCADIFEAFCVMYSKLECIASK